MSTSAKRNAQQQLESTSGDKKLKMNSDTYTLPALPWNEDELEPHTSAQTISFHYGKHHAGYVKKLNKAVGDMNMANTSLEKLITDAYKGTNKVRLYMYMCVCCMVCLCTSYSHSCSRSGPSHFSLT
jgi:Iron/manganese superoxide dismutases, alpha-hairpin domain